LSNTAAFVPSSGQIHKNKSGVRIVRNIPHPPQSINHSSRRSFVSKTIVGNNKMSSNSSTDLNTSETLTDTTQEWQDILPYQDHTHNSAKIIIPDPHDDTKDDETNDDTTSSSTLNYYKDLTPSQFETRLKATIKTLLHLQKSSLWISVPMSQSRYIESMTSIPALQFHHAQGNTAHLSLWLKENVENKIPEYATHQVGVGAMVVNSRNEILCVRELRKNYRPWKVPGGLADLGEQLNAAATREVLEETGIETEFVSVLGFRHTHGMQYNRSDLYFVCRLKPTSETYNDETGEWDIPDPIADPGEIAAAAWVPFQEFKDMVFGKDGGHPMMQTMIRLLEKDGEFDIQRNVVSSIVPGRKPSPLYHVALPDLEDGGV